MVHYFVAVLCLVSLSGLAASARADDPVAATLLEEGLNLREQGRDEEALTYFRRAYAVEGSAQALAQIALAEQAVGHWGKGYRLLLEAVTHTDDPWIASRAEALHGAIELAREHVVFLRVIGGSARMRVWVAGDDVGEAPLLEPVAVDIGEVPVEIRLRDAVVARGSVTTELGRDAEITLVPVIPPPPPRPVTPATVLGWTSLGVGAVGIGVGVAFHVMREAAVEDANRCIALDGSLDITRCSASIYEERNALVRRDSTWMTVGYIGGGILIATGIVLLIVGRRSDPDEDVAFSCGPSLTGIGATCAGTF